MSWNKVWCTVTWQAWAQMSTHLPCCWSSWGHIHPFVLREVKIIARYSSSPLHKHAFPLIVYIPPSFFFFLGWRGRLVGISRQLQSFWLLISTNPIMWTTQWAHSIISLEHHAIAWSINPGSHFSMQIPGEKKKKKNEGQPIDYHSHVNR